MTSLFGIAAVNPNNHPSLVEPPLDTVSSLQWHPSANYLLATSWDSKIRLWEIHEAQANATLKFREENTWTDPMLSSCWSGDGTTIFYGSSDCSVYAHSLIAATKLVLGKHEKPVCLLKWIKGHNLVMSGSWDQTLRLWDGRQPQPVHQLTLPERLYCGDVNEEVGVFATAERHILIFDLTNFTVFKQILSPLKFQNRCCKVFPNKRGYALGSIDGRVAIQTIVGDEKDFVFRDKTLNNAYNVNDLAFHPVSGLLATCSSDGGCAWWDKDNRKLVHRFEKLALPITHCSWNSTGSIFSYASGYDWSKGTKYKLDNPNMQTNIYLTKGVV